MLTDYVAGLAKQKQFELALRLVKLALPIWNDYAREGQRTYRDSVVGLWHNVDKGFLKNAIETIEIYLEDGITKPEHPGIFQQLFSVFVPSSTERYRQLVQLKQKFLEPIVALQDMDWILPYEVERVFYSVNNLLAALLGEGETLQGESMIYVSINQAIDALETSGTLTFDEINALL